jgi:flagellar motor switch protein FliN/FliY
MDTQQNSPAEGTEPNARRLALLLDVDLDISVELGRARMSIQELLGLGPGSVIELDKLAGEPLDILVNDRLIARGEAVVMNDKFGVRITDIVNPTERVARLR